MNKVIYHVSQKMLLLKDYLLYLNEKYSIINPSFSTVKKAFYLNKIIPTFAIKIQDVLSLTLKDPVSFLIDFQYDHLINTCHSKRNPRKSKQRKRYGKLKDSFTQRNSKNIC